MGRKRPERFSALRQLAEDAKKEYGVPLVENAAAQPGYTYIDTGVFSLDMALLGGFPEGYVTMIYGHQSTGKTTVAMRAAATAQRKHPDKAVVFVDAEGTYDPTWGDRHGVDNEALFLVSAETGEAMVNMVDGAIRTGETSFVIIDSLPALQPQADINAAAEDVTVASRARLISKLCSFIISALTDQRKQGNPVTVLFINQWRTRVGGFIMGDPRVLPGGEQPRYLATTMVEIKNKEIIGPDENGVKIVLENQHSFKVGKSKCGNSMRQGEFRMVRDPSHPLGAGTIDEAAQVIGFAKKYGMVSGGGGKFRIVGMDGTFAKRAELEAKLYADPELFTRIKQLVLMTHRRKMGLRPVPSDNWLLGPVTEETANIWHAWSGE